MKKRFFPKERSCNNTGKRQGKIVIAGHSGPSGLLQIDGESEKRPEKPAGHKI
ncbi:hypothetical protein K070079E91_23460 [Eisenbergiella porci]